MGVFYNHQRRYGIRSRVVHFNSWDAFSSVRLATRKKKSNCR